MIDYKSYPQDEALSPGTWNKWFIRETGLYAVMFKCTNGHIGTLMDHQITNDGTVSPSVVCPKDGCGYHEWIKLEGWTPVPR